MYTFSIFLFCLTIIPLLVGKRVIPFEGVRRMIIIVSRILPMTVLSSMSSFVIFSPHSFNLELILNQTNNYI